MNKSTQSRKRREKRRRQIAMFKANRDMHPMSLFLKMSKMNPLTEDELMDVTDKVVEVANKCSEDAKSLVPTCQDMLVRYDY